MLHLNTSALNRRSQRQLWIRYARALNLREMYNISNCVLYQLTINNCNKHYSCPSCLNHICPWRISYCNYMQANSLRDVRDYQRPTTNCFIYIYIFVYFCAFMFIFVFVMWMIFARFRLTEVNHNHGLVSWYTKHFRVL